MLVFQDETIITQKPCIGKSSNLAVNVLVRAVWFDVITFASSKDLQSIGKISSPLPMYLSKVIKYGIYDLLHSPVIFPDVLVLRLVIIKVKTRNSRCIHF